MNSFLQSSLGDATKYNYAKTSADLVEPVNKELDEEKKRIVNHFNNLIKQNNEAVKGRSRAVQQLASLTKTGFAIAKAEKSRREATEYLRNFFDINKVDEVQSEFRITDAIEAEGEAVQAEAYSTAGFLEAKGIDNEAQKLLRQVGDGSLTEKEFWNQAFQQWHTFKALAAGNLFVDLEGTFKTFDQVSGSDRNIVLKEIAERYVQQFIEQGLDSRLMDKYLIKPMVDDYNQTLTKYSIADAQAEKVADENKRKKQFYTNLNNDPNSAVEKFITLHSGYYENLSDVPKQGISLAKEALTNIIVEGLESELDPAIVEEMLQHELPIEALGNPTVKKYLGKTLYNKIDNAIRKRKDDTNKKNEEDKALAIINHVSETEKLAGNKPATQEFILERMQDWIQNNPNQPIPDQYKNWYTQQDIDDEVLDRALVKVWRAGGRITEDDLKGISDVEILARWRRLINSGLTGGDQRATDWIAGQVSQYTQDKELEKAKLNPLWIAVNQQAEDIYFATLEKEIEGGQSVETAHSIAREKTKAAINSGDIDKLPVLTRDEETSNSIINARKAYEKDNTILASPDYLEGEEPHLKAGYKFYKHGLGDIPQYYRSLAKGSKTTAFKMLEQRLLSTGLIKNSDLVSRPEDMLEPKVKQLLENKPSAGRTIRALSEIESIDELLEVTGYDNIEELQEDLRNNTLRNNALQGIDISQVNIDPSLIEEDLAFRGEVPFFNQYNNMLPGVATAAVEEYYNV